MKDRLVALLIMPGLTSFAWAETGIPIKPTARDKCPVCGMFVAKHPDLIACISFQDGSNVAFDESKDMFKYYLNMGKYSPTRKKEHIQSVSVIEYYDLRTVDAVSSFYVVGRGLYGPMGKELIPFDREAKAQEFLKDRKGRSILRFRDVSPSLLREIE